MFFFKKNNQRFELKFKKNKKKRLAASRPIFQKINQQFQKKNPALRAEIQNNTEADGLHFLLERLGIKRLRLL